MNATFTRYVSAGAVGTSMHYITLLILLGLDSHAWMATATGALLGALINYSLCRRWVFSTVGSPVTAEALRFLLVALACAVANASIMVLLAPVLGVWITQLLATVFVLASGFLIHHIWTFHSVPGVVP